MADNAGKFESGTPDRDELLGADGGDLRRPLQPILDTMVKDIAGGQAYGGMVSAGEPGYRFPDAAKGC